MMIMGYLNFVIVLVILNFMDVSLTNSNSIELNRELTGVHFNPYVKSATGQRLVTCLGQYSFNELKTMLEIVSTKFSRVVTNTVDAANVSYVAKETYYNQSCIVARTAEAAAVINRERNNKSLTVLIGVDKYTDDLGGEYRTATEVHVALEAEKIANSIYPGTVEGFQVSTEAAHLNDEISITFVLESTAYLKNRTEGKNLRIGLIGVPRGKFLSAQDISNSKFFSLDESKPHEAAVKKMIGDLDFINIKYYVNIDQARTGPYESSSLYSKLYVVFELLAQAIFPKLHLMQSSGWPSNGNYSLYNIDNMVNYWKAMNENAVINNRTIWLEEAFDNPINKHYITDFPYFGWWRLTRDDLASERSGYVEKCLETKTSSPPYLVWVWTGVGVTAAALVIFLLLALVVKIYNKVSSLKEALTKEEIEEFKYGLSETQMEILGEDQLACGTAIKKPYDDSLEISKDDLEIYWDQVLGSGQFGYVLKALWKSKSPKEVALKTTKRNCPASALRGILSEIKILTHLGEHSNIVSIYGAYTSELGKGKVYLITELCTGSLKSHLVRLSRNASESGDYVNIANGQEEMIRWSYEISIGMEYLEYKGVIHADLATRNVLLSSDGIAKISDFGLSRRLYDYSNYVKQQQEPLPWRWMAIESLRMMVFSHKSDVWSFGVTLWEIFAVGTEPYPGLSWSVDFVDRLEDGLRLTKPHLATPEIYELMQECWHVQPDTRPSFTALREKISNIRNNKLMCET